MPMRDTDSSVGVAIIAHGVMKIMIAIVALIATAFGSISNLYYVKRALAAPCRRAEKPESGDASGFVMSNGCILRIQFA